MAVKLYTLPEQGSTSRAGLEVYETDEENFEPYVSSGVVTNAGTDESSEEEEDATKFPLHQGDILKTFHYANLQSTEHEMDYKDMSASGSFKTRAVNKNHFYKGIRISLRKNWEEEDKNLKWDDLKTVLTGFITEQTFTETTTDVKISGMTALLDQKFAFKFTQMKRSEILSEIIKTAGLVPVIDVKGLDDDVTDFSNLSESSGSSSNSELAGGEGEEIDSLVKDIVGSETDELKKAQLIHGWLKKNVRYESYECSRYSSAAECLNHKGALNCADTARLTRAMMASAGLNCYVVHRSSHDGHFWTVIEIGGTVYVSDQTGSGSDWNTWWYSEGDRRACDSKGGDWDNKDGKNPSC